MSGRIGRIITRIVIVTAVVTITRIHAQTNDAAAVAATRPSDQPDSSTDKLHTAIDAGLTYLAGQQTADGSFQPAGPKLQASALALLSFLSVGDVPDSGRYGGAVRRATEFLLRQAPGDRYFGRVDGSRMRGHAIVTLALCEVYGVEPDEQTRVRLRATVKDAVTFIVAAQNLKPGDSSGGWSADPGGAGADQAVTFWCMTALHAARQIGLNVPQQNLDRGQANLKRDQSRAANSPPATNVSQHPGEVIITRLNSAAADLYQSPIWRSDCQAILSTQNSNGGWAGTDPQEDPIGTAATAMNVIILAAQDQLVPVFAK